MTLYHCAIAIMSNDCLKFDIMNQSLFHFFTIFMRMTIRLNLTEKHSSTAISVVTGETFFLLRFSNRSLSLSSVFSFSFSYKINSSPKAYFASQVVPASLTCDQGIRNLLHYLKWKTSGRFTQFLISFMDCLQLCNWLKQRRGKFTI